MSWLVPGIVRIGTRGDSDNCFLVTDGDGLTLVDVGWKSASTAILRTLEAYGYRPSDVSRIVITHAHPDHVRGLASIVEQTGARVLIHEADAPWLAAGRVPRAGRSGGLGRTLDRVPLLHWQPVTPDATVADHDVVDTLRVIHTPGHSPGHIALVHEPTGALLVGDALFHRGGLATGPDALAADPLTRNASYVRLPPDAAAIGFAHGPPLTGPDVAEFRRWLGSTTDPG